MATTTTNGLTYEQMVAMFGEEVAKDMQAQIDAAKGSGSTGAPFPYLKKISTVVSEFGAFGEFYFGAKVEKADDGTKKVIDKGTNVSSSFDFILVNQSYIYKRWNDEKQKTEVSNIFTSLGDRDAAVDYFGNRLPVGKEAKAAAGYKMSKINTGLIKVDSEWLPVIWEVSGKLFFTFNELAAKASGGGLMSCVFNVKTILETKGSTTYNVIDVKNSTVSNLPSEIFGTDKYKSMLSDITTQMKEYVAASKKTAATKPADKPAYVHENTTTASADADTGW